MRNRVKELRLRDGLTQAELADTVSVSRQSIISIENGRFTPSLPLAIRLARSFGEPVESVFLTE